MDEWNGTVLVTGAAGRLGWRIVARLRSREIPVRALVRTEAQAAKLRAVGAETVMGDMKDRASLERAVKGVTGIISAAGVGIAKGKDTPRSVDLEGNQALTDLAVREGVRRFVLISVLGAQNMRQSSIFAAKYHAEQYLRQSGVPFTIFRPGGLMSPYPQVWERGAKMGRYDVIGDPHRPLGLISPADLAELAVRALWEPAAKGHTFAVTNGEALTPAEIAGIHSRVFERPIRLRRLPLLLVKGVRPLVRLVRPEVADFMGFLQAVGEERFVGRPEEIREAFPGFEFEGYEGFLLRTREA